MLIVHTSWKLIFHLMSLFIIWLSLIKAKVQVVQVSPTWHFSFLEKASKPQNHSGTLPAPKNRVSGIATSPALLKHSIIVRLVIILSTSSCYCKTSQKTKVKVFNVTNEDGLLSSFVILFFFMLPAVCCLFSICILFLYYISALFCVHW